MLEKLNKYNIYLNRNAFISIIIKNRNKINNKKIFFTKIREIKEWLKT